MWISGTPVAASIASATLCIVLVQSTTHSAPAASSAAASVASISACGVPLPAACMASTSAKSTEDMSTRAEW